MTITTHFTTTNGYELIRYDDAKGSGGANLRDPDGRILASFSEPTWVALTEAVTHERDQRLGRTRDTVDPDLVIYPNGDNDVVVLSESTGSFWDITRPAAPVTVTCATPAWIGAAMRYFAAHPEPKPWHSAGKDQIWEVTIADETIICKTDADGDFTPVFGHRYWATIANGSEFTDARRIFPEVTP